MRIRGGRVGLPDRMNLAVIVEKQPSTHPWAEFRYDAIGIVMRDNDSSSVGATVSDSIL